jgi:hypothetical protein
MWSYLKNYGTELNIWKDAREPCHLRAASLIPLVLLSPADKGGLIQLEQSLLAYHLRFIVRVRSAYSYL